MEAGWFDVPTGLVGLVASWVAIYALVVWGIRLIWGALRSA